MSHVFHRQLAKGLPEQVRAISFPVVRKPSKRLLKWRRYFVESGQPERSQFIARKQSYHGNTLGALSVGGQFVAPRILPSDVDGCRTHCTLLCLS